MRRYYTRVCNFYYGHESRLLVNSNKAIPLNGNKNIYPKDKVVEKPEENDEQSSALGAMGLKPKIVH